MTKLTSAHIVIAVGMGSPITPSHPRNKDVRTSEAHNSILPHRQPTTPYIERIKRLMRKSVLASRERREVVPKRSASIGRKTRPRESTSTMQTRLTHQNKGGLPADMNLKVSVPGWLRLPLTHTNVCTTKGQARAILAIAEEWSEAHMKTVRHGGWRPENWSVYRKRLEMTKTSAI